MLQRTENVASHLVFKIKEYDNKQVTVYGNQAGLPYLANMLQQKHIAFTKLKTRIKIPMSRQTLEKVMNDTKQTFGISVSFESENSN